MLEFDTKQDAIDWLKTQKFTNMRNIYFVFESDIKTDETYNNMRFDGFNGSHNKRYHGVSEILINVAEKPARILCEWG